MMTSELWEMVLVKKRGDGQTFSTFFLKRFSQAPYVVINLELVLIPLLLLLSGNNFEYICF